MLRKKTRNGRARGSGFSVIVLAVLVALGSGLLIGVAVSEPPRPDALDNGSPVTSVEVSQRSFDDEFEVSVSILTEDKQVLATDAAGKITAFVCSPGDTLTSGTSMFSVDGQPVVNMFLPMPLWRDLAAGDQGADAAALNDELSRLGYSSDIGNSITWRTIAGFRQLSLDIGGSDESMNVIAKANILWLPAQSVSAQSCAKRAGDTIAPSDAVVNLPSALKNATITTSTEQTMPGARMLLLGGSEIPIAADGTITDPESLLVIAQSASFIEAAKESETATVQFNARWKLAKPVTVSVVPPGALIGISESDGCVILDGKTERISVVGSELGQSFVTFDGVDVTGKSVDLVPDSKTKCE